MASYLYRELLAMIFDEFADDLFTLHSCILVNRNWCVIALRFLWAKPFTLLNRYQRVGYDFTHETDNFLTTFIECFTDIDSLKNASQLCKKYSKKFPFDYSLYLKEIRFKEIQRLTARHFRFRSANTQFRIARLAAEYCPNLKTLSLIIPMYRDVDFYISTFPCLQNLGLSLTLDNSIFSTLSRTVHNLESISVEHYNNCTWGWLKDYYNFAKHEPHGLQKLIQSQHRLKTITIKYAIIKMSSLFKLLESQSNSLESIVVEDCDLLYSDDLNTEPINFHQLTSISIKESSISKGVLKSIIEADLPKLQQFKFEDTEQPEDWILLQNKYPNQIDYSIRLPFECRIYRYR